MKKKTLFCVLALICFVLLTSCSSNYFTKDLSSEPTSDRLIRVWDALDIYDVLYEKGDNYEIYTDLEKTGFYYYVKDNSGNLLDENYHGWRGGIEFDEQEKILKLRTSDGGNSWSERYYDIDTGRVSRFFHMPLQTYEEKIAYFDSTEDNNEAFIVVQNIFDSSVYYKELHGNIPASAVLAKCNVEFLDEGRLLKITYWAAPSYEAVTETFDL